MVFRKCISTTGAPLVQMSNCTFDNGQVVISRAIFKSNINRNGPAAIKITSKCHLHLERTSFIRNSGLSGAAVDIHDGARVTIETSQFKANVAFTEGGAVHVHGSTLFMDRCNFRLNLAKYAGGAIASKVSMCIDYLLFRTIFWFDK